MKMKQQLVAGLLALAASSLAMAADGTLSPQQQRMKDCNAEAKTKELKGDERKAFMKACLSGGKNVADAKPAAEKKPK